MTDPHFQSIQQYRDVESLNAYREMREAGIDEAEILTILGQKSRDNSRTPMQWNDEAHAGFTTGTPWIEVANNYNTVNVEAAMADPESILYTYKKLIQLRHEHDIVTYGEVVPRYLDHPQLFVYERRYQGDTWLIIANMTSEKVTLPEDLDRSGSVVLQNGIIEGNELEAYATIVVAR